MTTDTMRNVGTNGHPVSWLHQRALALIYDELTGAIQAGTGRRGRVDAGEVLVRLEPGGQDLYDIAGGVFGFKDQQGLGPGVDKVVLPGEWDQIGGVVPDLILYAEDQPIRIIEIIVKSPPTSQKRAKLDSLVKRGIDVVEITVEREEDLQTLCWTPSVPKYSALTTADTLSSNFPKAAHLSRQIHERDDTVRQLAKAVRECSPEARRELMETLCNANSLEALFPLRPGNPLEEQLKNGAAG